MIIKRGDVKILEVIKDHKIDDAGTRKALAKTKAKTADDIAKEDKKEEPN